MNHLAEADSSDPAVSETHISTVFFAGDRAYKLLKPIRTSFLDHSRTEDRLKAADTEIELNRRMAPDVYLGSADVSENGELVDRAIVMRRLPASRRLPRLIGTTESEPCLQAIARKVAAFHSKQDPILGDRAREIAGRDAGWTTWADNFADIEPIVGDVLTSDEATRVQDLADRYLEHLEGLFERRIDDGLVRDGHGDLTAEDIFCMPDGPKIIDCLAFDPRLRIADVLADVAFLTMDLDRLAGTATSRLFLDWYCEFSNEHHPASLIHHYVAYRANVRTKVAAIRHLQGDPGAAHLVRQYHELSLWHLQRAELTVLLVGGTPGTGKTTLARALSDDLTMMMLSTDELRKDLAGRSHVDHQVSPPHEGIYSPDMNERTYGELLDRAARLLDRGESVILDASWNDSSQRAAALAIATAKGARPVEIECVLDAETAKARIAARLAAGLDASDARPELVDELRARHDPWPAAVRIDTSGSPLDALNQVFDRVPSIGRRSAEWL